MGVRWVIGRAGAGKTHHCVGAMAHALQSEPLGPPLIWLVPEQATFTSERLLVTHPGVNGSFRSTVASFRRLAFLMAGELGLAQREPLDDLARTILLERLVRQHRDELELFKPVAERPGFIQRLDLMLRELVQYGHTPASLREAAERAGPRDPILPNKLHDLAILLDAWNETLAADHLDGERLLEQVAARAGETRLLKNARVWVDAFSTFNVLEIRMLVALVAHAAEVEITLLADPHGEIIQNPTAPLDGMSLFARTERTYRAVNDAFARVGIRPGPPLFMEHRPPRRFTKSPDLATIERELFSENPDAQPRTPEDIELWECPSPEAEVHAAAARVRHMVTVDGYRYRDIGLIIPDLAAYQDAVRRVFTHHGIPHFIDLRRSIAHHPLVELLRSAVAIPLHGFAAEDLALLLKTGLTAVDDNAAHALENYLLAHGIERTDLSTPFTFVAQNHNEDDTARPATPGERAHLAAINATRRQLHDALAPWVAVAQKPDTPGDVLTRELYALLSRLGAPARLTQLIDSARQRNDPELLMIHQQTWRQTTALLETLEKLLAGHPTALADFSRTLEAALETLTLGLIPPTLDQVLVNSVTRSRHPELCVAIILGALESRFPLVKPEDPLLNDRQRELFNQSTSGSAIQGGSAVDLIESRFLDYVAFTRAHEKLVVSFPLADDQGHAAAKSQYVSRLRALYPKLEPKRPGGGSAEQTAGSDAADLAAVATPDDAIAATLAWARRKITVNLAAGEPANQLMSPSDASRIALYQWLVANPDPHIQQALAASWWSLEPRPRAVLSPQLAARFFDQDLRMSVSRLEKFGACPLQYFLHYTLGLKQRDAFELDGLNLGLLQHRVLERVYDRIIRHQLPWPECQEHDLHQALEHEVEQAVVELHAELAQNTPAYAKVRQRITRDLGMVLEQQRRIACAGDLRPRATEMLFGGRPDPHTDETLLQKVMVSALTVKSARARKIHLNGKIDRVDVDQDSRLAVVIDYKSGKRELALDRVYHGLDLQLPVYLLVLREFGRELSDQHRPLSPLAGFYVPLKRNRTTKADLASAPEPGLDEFYNTPKPRGLADAEGIDHLDRAMADQGSSQWFSLKINKDGSFAKNGDLLSHEDFQTVLAYTQHKIAAMVDALVEGEIEADPYQEKSAVPCTQCDYASLCPFDRINGNYRKLPQMAKSIALEKMAEALAAAKP